MGIQARQVEWLAPHKLEIQDLFSGPGQMAMRGAFHLGACQTVTNNNSVIEADFGGFMFLLDLPPKVSIEIYYGSEYPFIGWRSTIYGKWEPIHSIIYSRDLQENDKFTISLRIIEK